jgi:hypothetical protein
LLTAGNPLRLSPDNNSLPIGIGIGIGIETDSAPDSDPDTDPEIFLDYSCVLSEQSLMRPGRTHAHEKDAYLRDSSSSLSLGG